MSKILLVEDDPVLGTGLKINLELEGYDVQWARDLRSAHGLNSDQRFDLAVLDLGLPDGSGLSFCQGIRNAGSRMPIIILTAQTDEDSVVSGLSAGANDYVRKPFGNREILARIKTALREPLTRDQQIRFGDILVLRDQRKVMFGSNEVELNRREFEIFLILIESGDSVVTRERLLSSLDRDGEILDRTLDSHLSHIRSKLRKAGILSLQITSVYGVGYRLEKP